MKLHALGIDLGKTVFHLVGLDAGRRIHLLQTHWFVRVSSAMSNIALSYVCAKRCTDPEGNALNLLRIS
jgi:hypothetical protein